ncbi:MAG: surface lipoprotein assembly modifier [Thermodesulfobacteriota bacterium]
MIFSRTTIVGLCLLLCGTTASAALATETHWQRGKTFFENKQHEEAYHELHMAFREDPANLELNFLLGRAAFESGRLEEAAMAYERILIADPGADRVKLELARTYLGLGSRELARQYFHEVLATNPPEQVWKNIEGFLAAIEQSEKRHTVNGIFSLGISLDDNASVAPDNKIIDVRWGGLNLPFTISQEPVDDVITSTTLVLNHLYRNENLPFSWKTTATNYNAFYASQNSNDLNLLNLTTGPAWQGDRHLFQLYLQGTYADVAYDRYLGAAGLGASLTWLVNQQLSFVVNAIGQQKDYYQDDNKDAGNLLLSAGPVFTFGANRISIAGAAEHEDADSGVESYDRATLFARYDRALPYDVGAYLSFRYQDTDYDEINPLFGVARSDQVYDYTVGLSRQLWQSADKRQSLAGQLFYTRTEADSNLGLYEYSKNLVATTLTLAF